MSNDSVDKIQTEKLQKVLASQGYGSRRGMEQWIKDGRVSVNGKKAHLGDRVSLRDKISVDNAVITRSDQSEGIKLLQYNKPEGEICSRNDPKGRPTVFDNLPRLLNGRWLSIGRLDLNTSGLLLFTNNGELANKLMHPSTGVQRRYLARIRGKLTQQELEAITESGVEVDGKLAKFTDVVVVDREDSAANHWVEVGIEEGRNREVRKIFEATGQGHAVSRLKRISYGGVNMMSNVRLGHAKEMPPMQIEKMLKFLGLDELVAKVRPYQDGNKPGGKGNNSSAKQLNRKPNKQAVKGSREASERSRSDKLAFQEKQLQAKRTKKFKSSERKRNDNQRKNSIGKNSKRKPRR